MDATHDCATDRPIVPYFDHNSPDYARDRFRWYEAIRAQYGPIAWSPHYGGFWIVVGREELVEAAKDWKTFSSYGPIESNGATAESGCPVKANGLFLPPRPKQGPLIEEDPPAWNPTRRALNPLFLPHQVSLWRDRMQTIVDAAVDQVIERGQVDFTPDIAETVSTVFSLELVGVEPSDPTTLAQAMNTTSHHAADHPHWAPAAAIIEQEAARITAAVGVPMQPPAPGGRQTVIATLRAAREAGAELSDAKISELAMLVLGAGFDTTASVVATTLMMISQDEGLRQSLIDRPESVVDAFDEFLRLSSPTSGLTRTAMRDTELGGRKICKGDRVMLCYAAANRDAREFPDPDRFRLSRRSNRHVAFGSGLHRCLGAHYAQLEFETIITTVLRRMPDFRIHAERAYKYDNIGLVDGWVSLPATFTPGPRLGARVAGIGPAARHNRRGVECAMVTKEHMQAVMEKYCRCQSERDKGGWLSLFDPSIIHEDPVGGTNTNVGLDQIANFWEHFPPNLKVELTRPIIARGNEAIVFMRAELDGPDQRIVTEPIIDNVWFNDEGKITRVRAFYD